MNADLALRVLPACENPLAATQDEIAPIGVQKGGG